MKNIMKIPCGKHLLQVLQESVCRCWYFNRCGVITNLEQAPPGPAKRTAGRSLVRPLDSSHPTPAQGTFRSLVPYFEFTESIIALAMTLCPDTDGWTPSSEN